MEQGYTFKWHCTENEFESEEEIERDFNELVKMLGKDVAEMEEKATVVNQVRVEQLYFVYDVMRYLTKDIDAVVGYELNAPFKTTGGVSVESESIEIYNTKWFSRASEFADNVEIYPLANGNVKLTFTFHGLMVPEKQTVNAEVD